MPWTCPVCAATHAGAPPPAPAPKCYKTAPCKSKNKNSGADCTWAVPQAAPVVVVLTEAQQAAGHGYVQRLNTHLDKFPHGHKTSVMFANAGQTRGISPDGSTHSGGRSGWKGFENGSGGWTYCGSFQPDLTEWPHRPNDRIHVMPPG